MIDTLKNVIEADRTYMQNQQALEGWIFVNYIALHWYYKVYQLLVEKELISKYDPTDILKMLTEVRKVKINQTWLMAETTIKSIELFSKPGLHIT